MRFWFGVMGVLSVVLLVGCKATHRHSKMQMNEGQKKMEKGASYSSADVVSVHADKVVCKLGSDERQILRRKPESGGCEVVYLKTGEEKVVANAQNDLSYCDTVMGRIQKNLQQAGFACDAE